MKSLSPETLSETVSLLAAGGCRLVSGGTAIEVERTNGRPLPETLVDLSRVEDPRFRALSRLWIGSCVTLADIAAGDVPAPISEAARAVGAPAIRRLGTLGGQIGGRTGCMLPALLVADAVVHLATAGGERSCPLRSYLSAPDGVVIGISLPEETPGAYAAFRKIGLRNTFSPSVINVAVWMAPNARGRLRSVRLAVGGGTTFPCRLAHTEQWLDGQSARRIDWQEVGRRLFAEIQTVADIRRSDRFKASVAANTLVALLGGDIPPRASPRPERGPRPSPPHGERELLRSETHDAWRLRPDLQGKLEGQQLFHTDRMIAPDGRPLLVACVLLADIPHARILRIDTTIASTMPGVRAIVTAGDIEGENSYGIVFQDRPALAADRVRFLGEAIAAVAADTEAQARAAVRAIRVEYEKLPVVSDVALALLPDAPLLHPAQSDNICAASSIIRGDVDRAFEICTTVVSEEYTTPRQMHAYMETEGGWAWPRPDGVLEVHVGAQYGARDAVQLGRILGRPSSSFRIVSSPTGGSFGGKDDLTIQPALCLLALKAGQGVRLRLDRHESVLFGQKGAPFHIRLRTGCDAEGRILAHEAEVIADCGAYASLSPAVLETAIEHVCGPYRIGNVRASGRLVYTNNGVTGALRGFGANHMNFAVETQIDRLAAMIGVEPADMRARNLRTAGDLGAYGDAVVPFEGSALMLRAAAASPLWGLPVGYDAMHKVMRGVGMSMIYQGNGLGSKLCDPVEIDLRLTPEGKIRVALDLVEMGQGVVSIIAGTAARALGCAMDDLTIILGDTAHAPDTGPTSASRGTIVTIMGLAGAVPPFCAHLLEEAARILCHPVESLHIGPGGIYATEEGANCFLPFQDLCAACPSLQEGHLFRSDMPNAGDTEHNARFLFCMGSVVARVAVSVLDGHVEVTDLELHTAAGQVLDLSGYLGQLEGGLLQAVGFAFMEDARFAAGRPLMRNFDSYMLPTVQDTPARIRVFAHESLPKDDPAGARGLGEVGMSATAPALANAIADATGIRLSHAPFDPERILDGLGTLFGAGS